MKMHQMIFLSLVLTFNIGTSIASYEFNQRVRPRLEKSSIKVDSFITEGFRAPATISNATYEDIMMELGWMPQIQQGCHFSAGPYGGSDGNAFNELPNNCGASVSQILIRSGSVIDAIQLTYRYSDGTYHTGGYYGGTGGGSYTDKVDLTGGEEIIGILGRSAVLVDQLGFVTNKGRIFGPYGETGGSDFKVQSCIIRGIFGRSAALLDSIGFQCSNV